MFDLEGTLVKGKGFSPLPGAVRALEQCSPNVIVTNNTTHAPGALLRRLREAGLPVEEKGLLTPMVLLPTYLRRRGCQVVLSIGSGALSSLLREHGFVVREEGSVDAVVVGLHTALEYTALRRATRALLGGASLVALHRNRLFQDRDGGPSPSAGATVAFLEHAAGAVAELLGKPSRPFFELALEQLGARPEECCVVGDDPFTEVEGAKALGMRAVFVLTGKYPSTNVLDRLPASRRPDLVVASLDELPCLREPDL